MRASASVAGAAGQYSPSKRTGLVFSGTGTHGVYHAGVLRALQEAGVRVDVVAGHGIGAVTATLAALDGGATLWDEGGLWLASRVSQYYRWRWPLRVAAWLMALLAGVLLIPVAVLFAGALAYAAGFLLALAGASSGEWLVGVVSARTAAAFSGPQLPTLVPRLAVLVLFALVLALAAGVVIFARPQAGMSRTSEGRWWRMVSSPLDTAPLRDAVVRILWTLVRGAGTAARPSSVVLSRRLSEVLTENMGQPGCRELMLGVTDLDARRDLVGAALSAPFQEAFFASQPGRERGAEVLDLTGSGKDVVVDLLDGALTPALGAEAHACPLPSDGYWAGETHRTCDRPGMVARLLAELDTADVVQVIVVSAAAPALQPHRLKAPRVDPRSRLGEFFTASESAAIDDAVSVARNQFDAVYLIRPSHNPVGPFEATGVHDPDSDRHRSLAELRQQGYTDAYAQFIDPVVGASGEHLGA